MSNVFISYSRKDADFVTRLERALSARQKNVWLDIEDIAPGAEWREEIHLGLQACDGVVFVMSPDSLGSGECGKELGQAFELNKRIVPVLHREPSRAEVPQELANINWVRLRQEDDFDDGVEKLIEALDKDFQWVHEHTRLGNRAAEWTAHGRDRAYLLRGSDLTQAEEFLTGAAGKQPEPTADQLEYVAASRAAAKSFNQRLLGAVTAALLVAITLSIVAFLERSSAVASQKHAYSRQLAADAETQLGIDPELSVLLAAKAYDVNPTAESLDILRQALATSKIRMAVRPPGGVSEAALTPDGQTLVTVGRSEGAVRLWRYPRGTPLGRLPGVSATRGQLAVNPVDGRILVVDRASGQARVFRGMTPEPAPAASSIITAAWAGGGRYILTGAGDGTVAVWNGSTGRQITHSRDAAEPIVDTAMSSGAHFLAAMTRSGAVLLYDLRASRVWTLQSGCGSGQGELLFSPDGTRLLTYGSDCSATLRNTSTRRAVGDLSSYAQGITSAAFPSDTTLVIASEVAAVIDPVTGAQQGQYLGHDGLVNAVAAVSAPCCADVATAGQDGTIRLWDSANPTATAATLQADAGSIGSLSAAQGGRELVSVDGDDSAARVWDSGIPFPVQTLGNQVVTDLGAISPDGRLALADDTSGILGLFDPQTGAERVRLAGSGTPLNSVQGPSSAGFIDGHRLVYLLTPSGLRVWRTRDGSSLPLPGLDAARVRAVAAAKWRPRLGVVLAGRSGSAGTVESVDPLGGRPSLVAREQPDVLASDSSGALLALAHGRDVRVVVVATGRGSRLRVRGGSGRIAEMAFSADGRRAAIAGSDFLDVFSLPDGRLVGHPLLVGGARLASVALSYHGSMVAAGYSDLRARVWTLPTDQLLTTAKEPKQPEETGAGVTTVQISRNGDFLLTAAPGASDTEIWDTASGSRLYTFNGFFAGWTADSHMALTTGGPAQSWSCDLCVSAPALRQLARTRVTRGLTPAERARYLAQ